MLGAIKVKLAFAKFIRIIGVIEPFAVGVYALISHEFLLIILGIAVSIFLLLWGLHIRNSAMNQYGQSFVLPMARQVFPGAEFTYIEKHLDLDRFHNLGLITRDKYEKVTNHLVSNDEHELENFSLLCEHTESDSDGDSRTVTTYSGTVVSYKTPTGIQGVVRVIASGQFKILFIKKETTFVRGKSPIAPWKIETGSVAFDDNFEVYASDQHLGYYVLNAYVIEKLQAFRAKYGTFALTITSDYLYAAFDHIDKFISVPETISSIGENPFEDAKRDLNELIESLNDISFAISKSTQREKII
jgi:hypothetical protein